MFRFAVTFSCWSHVSFTYGSDAETMADAYRDALHRARPALATLGGVHMIEVEDRLFRLTRRIGKPATRRGRWDYVH